MRSRYRARGQNSVNGLVTPKDRPDIARTIASIMTRQRRGLDAPEFDRRAGKLDRRRMASIATGNERVFTTRTARSTSRLKVVVLLDLSGSMHGSKAQDAVQTAWDFILASRNVPTMDLEVWGHTTGWLNADEKPLDEVKNQKLSPELEEQQKKEGSRIYGISGVREGHYVVAYHLYEKGMNARQFFQQLKDIQMSGNEDGWALDAVLNDVTRRARSNERVLCVVVSDGAPIYSERGNALGHVRAVVNRWRRRGVAIVSVSIDPGMRKEAQNNMYGHEWVVPYTEDASTRWGGRYYWEPKPDGLNKSTIVNMGRVIGRALN